MATPLKKRKIERVPWDCAVARPRMEALLTGALAARAGPGCPGTGSLGLTPTAGPEEARSWGVPLVVGHGIPRAAYALCMSDGDRFGGPVAAVAATAAAWFAAAVKMTWKYRKWTRERIKRCDCSQKRKPCCRITLNLEMGTTIFKSVFQSFSG